MPRATVVLNPTFVGEGVVRSNDIEQDPRYGQSEPHLGMPAGTFQSPATSPFRCSRARAK